MTRFVYTCNVASGAQPEMYYNSLSSYPYGIYNPNCALQLVDAATLIPPSQASPFDELAAMTIGEAQAIATQIAVLWAIAWGIRVIAHSLKTSERQDHE